MGVSLHLDLKSVGQRDVCEALTVLTFSSCLSVTAFGHSTTKQIKETLCFW